MAFPAVATRTATTDAGALSTRAISLGSPSAGQLIVVVAAAGNPGAILVDTAISGKKWHVDLTGANGSGPRLAVFWKVAEGSDALQLITTTSVRLCAEAYLITGHGSSLTAAAVATATSTNGDPPNVTQSGAAQDTLFLAVLAGASAVASGAPAGYSSLTTTSSSSIFLSLAEKTANATSDNPATFTNTSQVWVATTLAIPSTAIATNARETQEAAEVLSHVSPNAIITQEAVEVLSANALKMQTTQVAVEVLSANALKLQLTQLALEVLSKEDTGAAHQLFFFL